MVTPARHSTLFATAGPPVLVVCSLQALSSFARSVSATFTSQNLLDAFTATPQHFWALMSNQIIGNMAVRPDNFSQGTSYTALSNATLTLAKDDTTGYVGGHCIDLGSLFLLMHCNWPKTVR